MKLARLAPLVLLALVGCSPSPSVAAQVGDEAIAQKSVSDLVEACPAVGATPITPKLALQMLINMEIFYQVAESTEVELDAKELRSLLLQDEDFGPFLAQEPDCADLLLPEVTFGVLGRGADPEKLNAALEQVDVEVNPRYGVWADGQGVVGSGSLSVPVNEV